MDQPLVYASVSYNLRLFTVAITRYLDFLNSILMLMIVKLLGVYFQKTILCFNLNTTEIAIFGVPEHGVSLTNDVNFFIAFASLLARRRILLQWKSKNLPKALMVYFFFT